MAKSRLVQCKECGNLCVQHLETGENVPMSRQRRNGEDPTDFEFHQCDATPVCALGLVRFESIDDPQWTERRICDDGFVQYEPGLNLERYTDMRLLDSVRAENRRIQWIMVGLTAISVLAAVVSAIANMSR